MSLFVNQPMQPCAVLHGGISMQTEPPHVNTAHSYVCRSASMQQKYDQEEKRVVFSFKKQQQHHSCTSGRVQIPAGGHLGLRHAEQHTPLRPIPSQTKTGAPRCTHVERRSPPPPNQPNTSSSILPSELRLVQTPLVEITDVPRSVCSRRAVLRSSKPPPP